MPVNDFVIGDMHLGAVWDGLDRTNDVFDILYLQIIPAIKAKQPNRIIFLGDVFHSSTVSNSIIARFIDFLDDLSDINKQMPIVILKGNHDGEPTSSKGSPLQIIESTGLAQIMWEPQAYGQDLFIPYCTQEDMNDFLQDYLQYDMMKFERAYTHVDIPGAVPGTEATVTRGAPCLLPQEIINKSELVVGGHIHKFQQLGNVLILGSIIRTSISEANDKKHVLADQLIELDSRDLKHFDINITSKNDFDNLLAMVKTLDLSGKIISCKAICAHTIAHEIDFNVLEKAFRDQCYYLRWESIIHKEKQYRMRELENNTNIYEIAKAYITKQGISDQTEILEEVANLIKE